LSGCGVFHRRIKKLGLLGALYHLSFRHVLSGNLVFDCMDARLQHSGMTKSKMTQH